MHLLSPKPGEEMPGDDRGDRQARLLAAYADAGILWAKVVGNSIALADGLLGQDRWDDVLRLADFLDHAGETVVADSLRGRANDAIRGEYYARISRIQRQDVSRGNSGGDRDPAVSPQRVPGAKARDRPAPAAARGVGKERHQARSPGEEYRSNRP